MSDKRFVLIEDDLEPLILDNGETMSVNEVVDLLNRQQTSIETMLENMEKLEKENEQLRYVKNNCRKQQVRQANTIHKLIEENKELGKNFDDITKWASKIAKRNVVLDEKIGKIQQGIRIAYEKKPYPSFEDIEKEINNE